MSKGMVRRSRRWRPLLGLGLVVALLAPAFGPRVSMARAASGDWPMYLYGIDRPGFNPTETDINASTAASLKPRWIDRATDPSGQLVPDTISTQPVVVNGVVYWGSWDGYEHATDVSNGSEIWHTYLGNEVKTDCSPPALGVASTAAVTTIKYKGSGILALLLGGGNGTFYAVNAANGAILWQTPFGSPQQGYFLWSSPVVYNRSVYMGVASIGDCPLIPGALVKMNASNGAIQQIFNVVPSGCTGGGVWGSVTIDAAADTLYFGTGTTGSCNPPNSSGQQYSQAVIELKARNLSLLGAWQVPPAEAVTDGDFGATPTLFTATIGGSVHPMVGLANKNGIYYAFYRDKLNAGPVWRSQTLSTVSDTIAPSAWDGTRLYVAAHDTTINAQSCEGSLRALDPATGAFIWQDCLSGGGANGAVMAVPGLVVEGIGSILYAVDATLGNVLFSYQDTSFHWFYAPATISDGVLYAANSDGQLYAFTPNGV